MSLTDGLLLDPARFHVRLSTRTDSEGSGTITDPYRADTAARFDSLMRSFPAGTVAHLSPGEFRTVGFFEQATIISYGITLKARMKIVGSGIDVTTLKLVLSGSTANNREVFAITHKLD